MPDPPHQFDADRASPFRPRDRFAKSAILVDLDADTEITINATFGEQRLRGPFYVVADGDGSYGAAKRQFEETHTRVDPVRWIKNEGVDAYQIEGPCTVETYVDDLHETTVEASAGDWIVRQRTGEVMVITPESFDERYVPAD